MAKTAPFVLPAGVRITTDDGKLTLEYDGDIVIQDTLGLEVGSITAGGDLTIDLPVATGALQAGGTLTIEGAVDATRVHARDVVLGKEPIKVRAISADQSIRIGAATLAVDVIIAPEIDIHAKATGRCPVIESHNDRGASKIKGGFSLAEYEELFGDSASFLAERGVSPLDGSAAVTADDGDTEDEVGEVEADAIEEIDDLDVEAIDEEDEATAGPEASLEPIDDDLHPKLNEALKRIVSCYDGEIPPAVGELQGLVDSRDYDRLRTDITEVWNGLLAFHQQRGIRPHHQVTHAFNIIHGLVQEMA